MDVSVDMVQDLLASLRMMPGCLFCGVETGNAVFMTTH